MKQIQFPSKKKRVAKIIKGIAAFIGGAAYGAFVCYSWFNVTHNLFILVTASVSISLGALTTYLGLNEKTTKFIYRFAKVAVPIGIISYGVISPVVASISATVGGLAYVSYILIKNRISSFYRNKN